MPTTEGRHMNFKINLTDLTNFRKRNEKVITKVLSKIFTVLNPYFFDKRNMKYIASPASFYIRL